MVYPFCFSGGHTAELLTLMSAFRQQFGHRIYIVSDTDKLSEQKVKYVESVYNLSFQQVLGSTLKVICCEVFPFCELL